MKHRAKQTDRVRAAVDSRSLLTGLGTLGALAILLVVGLAPEKPAAPEPPPGDAAQVDSAAGETLLADCQVIQHMTYTPCGHALTRRQPLPPELVGKGRADVEASYDLWQITGFSAAELEMEQTLPIHCPEHQVLMPDASGLLCVFENRYGDALALTRALDTPLSSFPEEVQEELRSGKGFDSLEELERWLETAES